MADLYDMRTRPTLKSGDDSIKEKPRYRIDDEEEETYMYDVRKPMEFINEGKNGVFDIKMQTGINSAKSVFDKGAAFKTRT